MLPNNKGQIIQQFELPPVDNHQAYESVLENLFLGENSEFISPETAMEALRIITQVLNADVSLNSYDEGWSGE